MSWFSKIVVGILLVLSFFFVKEKFFGDEQFKFVQDFFNKKPVIVEEKETNIPPEVEENAQKPAEVHNKKEKTYVYFLSLDKERGSVFKKVERTLPEGENKLDFAITELLKGPSYSEKSKGTYNEIPKGTRLISIKQKGNNVIIDLSSEFQYGGGTDSIYSRMRQLIKTALLNAPNKNIYLYLDGKQVDVLGGEGIMVSQPLSEKSLDE